MIRNFLHALAQVLTAFDRLHAIQYYAPWCEDRR